MRPHQRAPAGYCHRTKSYNPQSAKHRRHIYRNLRLLAPALCSNRANLFSGVGLRSKKAYHRRRRPCRDISPRRDSRSFAHRHRHPSRALARRPTRNLRRRRILARRAVRLFLRNCRHRCRTYIRCCRRNAPAHRPYRRGYRQRRHQPTHRLRRNSFQRRSRRLHRCRLESRTEILHFLQPL